MQIGDIVVRKSYGKDVAFKIIDIKTENDKIIYVLKGINIRIEADSSEDDLEAIEDDSKGEKDRVFNSKVNTSIKKILMSRMSGNRVEMTIDSNKSKIQKIKEKNKGLTDNELMFGRPGKILHIDGDATYLEVCLKTYKQLALEATGRVISEREQPTKVLEIVKEVKPDIVVITGHDGMAKGIQDYMDLKNYRNSKYFVETVTALRAYESNYDDLVIFAGACQSCYEAILDAGANFASSPSRVLIHCLDPVLVSEKVAYTTIDKIVNIEDVIQNTITGIKGIGGLQTRGKYRQGFPKSQYIK